MNIGSEGRHLEQMDFGSPKPKGTKKAKSPEKLGVNNPESAKTVKGKSPKKGRKMMNGL